MVSDTQITDFLLGGHYAPDRVSFLFSPISLLICLKVYHSSWACEVDFIEPGRKPVMGISGVACDVPLTEIQLAGFFPGDRNQRPCFTDSCERLNLGDAHETSETVLDSQASTRAMGP